MLKRIALVALGLILIGFAGIITTAAIHKQSIDAYVRSWFNAGITTAANFPGSQNYDQSGTVDGTSVKSVQVTVSAASVHVYPSSGNQISAHAYGYVAGVNPNDFTFEVKKNGSQAIVSLTKQNMLFSFGTTIHLNVDVEVPQQVYDQMNVQAFAGKVNIENLSAKQFVLHSSAGSVNGSNLTGNVQATSSAGSVKLTDVKGDVDLQSSAGSVVATSIDGSIKAHSSAGSVEIHLQNITHDITAGSSAGSVRVTSAESPQNLQFMLHASAGSVHFGLPNASFTTNQHADIQGSIGQGGPMLNVETSAGSVDVNQGPLS